MARRFTYYANSAPYVDPDVQAFYTASGITDTTQKAAINTLVLGLKSAGIWSKMRALYPFVGGNATAHSYNLKDPSQYQLTFMGGWVHDANGGLPNGTNGYAKTGLIPNGLMTFNSNHLGFYNTSAPGAPTVFSYNMGASDDAGLVVNQLILIVKFNSNLAYYDADSSYNCSFNQTANGRGLTFGTMNGTSTQELYYNNVLKASAASGGSLLPSKEIYIGGANANGTAGFFTDMRCGLASIGDGLSSSQSSDFYTLIQAYQTTLSRQA